jgi:hypothetical protein
MKNHWITLRKTKNEKKLEQLKLEVKLKNCQYLGVKIGDDRKAFQPYGVSLVEKAAAQLRLMEDAMVVYRLVRAPEPCLREEIEIVIEYHVLKWNSFDLKDLNSLDPILTRIADLVIDNFKAECPREEALKECLNIAKAKFPRFCLQRRQDGPFDSKGSNAFKYFSVIMLSHLKQLYREKKLDKSAGGRTI